MHFPNSYDYEYFKQLTAETAITKYKNGFPYRVWVKTKPRNEALDITVYNFAALEILNPDFERIKMSFEEIKNKDKKEEIKKTLKPSKIKRKSNWVSGWKK